MEPHTHGISTPYPWYFDPPTHAISTPLLMVFWPHTHGILTPLPMLYRPLYLWYFDPIPMVFWSPTHGTSTTLSMVIWPRYPWYIEPLPISSLEMRGVKIPWGFNLPYKGGLFSIRGVNIPWGSKYHMTPVLSSFMTYHRICNQINTTSTTSGAGTVYLSRAPKFSPGF